MSKMQAQTHPPFGIDDRLPCPSCDAGFMRVTRRSPHPVLGGEYELQYLSCSECGHEQMRGVDAKGNTKSAA